MRNLKKFLALVLAMMMTLSLMVTVNAKNVEFDDGENVNEAFIDDLTVLAGMGVIKGMGDGTFKPQTTVTRAEMAAIVYRLRTGDADKDPEYKDKSAMYAGYGDFSDVKADDWFAGYVGFCANAGIIIGYPDGSFGPQNPVTGYEALVMLLRAMGYDQPNEFTGGDWRQHAASIATQRGMLAKVNTTRYRGTLMDGAAREVIAEITFQAATKAQVQYTAAFGYQTTGMTGGVTGTTQNPSLGRQWFGLTSLTGIVLGNQATGEKDTKIGFTTDGTATSRYISEDLNEKAYIYVSGANNLVGTDNLTLTFTGDPAKTGLDMFGHKVEVWCDFRGDGKTFEKGFSNNLPTYAIFDEAEHTALVTGVTDLDATKAADLVNNPERIASAAKDEGLKLNADTKVNWNYSFGPMTADNYGTNGGSVDSEDYASPIHETDAATGHPLYVLISNNSDKILDMVISLDLTVTKVTQQNDTAKVPTVGVNAGNGDSDITAAFTKGYFGINGDASSANKVMMNIAQSNLLDTKDAAKTLGAKVVAIEITGTNDTNVGADGTGNATAATGMNSTFYYQFNELTNVKKLTVAAIDHSDESITLSDGTILERSPLALAVDAGFKGTTYVNAPTAYGEYNFTLDADGKYIFWEPITTANTFVYGTYLDYESVVGSSTFRYPLVGVDLDGKQVLRNVVSFTDKGDPDPSNPSNVLALDPTNYASNDMGLVKRGSDDTDKVTSWKGGKYVGYVIDEDGNLAYVKDATDAWNKTGVQQAKVSDFGGGGADKVTTIGATDVALGIKQVTDSDLYLTENTLFYIVSGAGTDTQKVTPVKGLSALMEGMDQVIIDGDTQLTAGTKTSSGVANPYITSADTEAFEMIYYTSSPFNYAQDYATSAYQVDTVFIPEVCLHKTKTVSNSLVFVGDSTPGLVNAVGSSNAATQFTMYVNGVEGKYWIKGVVDNNGTPDTSYSSDADTILDFQDNVFYNLVDSGKKAADGQPIYEIAGVGSTTAAKLIGDYYDGTTTKATSALAGSGATKVYKAATRNSQVALINVNDGSAKDVAFNVASATVKNLDTTNWPGITDLATLNAASSVEGNTGITVSCILSEDSSNRFVSVIYVDHQ